MLECEDETEWNKECLFLQDDAAKRNRMEIKINDSEIVFMLIDFTKTMNQYKKKEAGITYLFQSNLLNNKINCILDFVSGTPFL
jgi:hypothetical protein